MYAEADPHAQCLRNGSELEAPLLRAQGLQKQGCLRNACFIEVSGPAFGTSTPKPPADRPPDFGAVGGTQILRENKGVADSSGRLQI